jgi:hypothetical protein
VFSEEKMEDELPGEATVNITDTKKSGDFDGASHFLYPGCCRINTQDRLGAIGPSTSSPLTDGPPLDAANTVTLNSPPFRHLDTGLGHTILQYGAL